MSNGGSVTGAQPLSLGARLICRRPQRTMIGLRRCRAWGNGREYCQEFAFGLPIALARRDHRRRHYGLAEGAALNRPVNIRHAGHQYFPKKSFAYLERQAALGSGGRGT
jgi:hypothetical protein